MQKLVFKGTEETPAVTLDKDSGIFDITGKSFMEDVNAYYEPIIGWLEEYKKSPNEETVFHFNVEYINTASSKMFLDVLTELEDIFKNGDKVKVIWKYLEDDEDMESTGHEFKEMFEMPFEFKMLK
mgnify:CR=1 FL=1